MPVLVGTAAAGHVVWWRFGAALLVAAGLQIGVNLANDAFDGMKGVDTPERVGPPRLTQTRSRVAEGGARRRAGFDRGRRRSPGSRSRSRRSPR